MLFVAEEAGGVKALAYAVLHLERALGAASRMPAVTLADLFASTPPDLAELPVEGEVDLQRSSKRI